MYQPGGYGWSIVCDDYWDSNDGSVVCRQLGYSGVSNVHHGAVYGQGSSSYILNSHPQCNGYESRIGDCSTNLPWSYTHGCSRSEAVGIDCY